MSDTVLDLSAKSTSDEALAFRSLSRDNPPSPTTPVKRHLSLEDGNDSDSSSHPGSSGRVINSSIALLHRDGESPSSSVDVNEKRSPASSPLPQSSLAQSPRLFKSFPSDSMASIFSPPSPGMLSGHNGIPTSLPVGIGLSSFYDTSAGFPTFPITPLTSHLLQRKRRAESRVNSVSQDSNSDSDSKSVKHVPEEKKDSSYWERRRKNNEAAKRSRDNRRQKEEEIAMRAAFLEQENLKLRAQVAILKNETAKLHYMLYNRI